MSSAPAHETCSSRNSLRCFLQSLSTFFQHRGVWLSVGGWHSDYFMLKGSTLPSGTKSFPVTQLKPCSWDFQRLLHSPCDRRCCRCVGKGFASTPPNMLWGFGLCAQALKARPRFPTVARRRVQSPLWRFWLGDTCQPPLSLDCVSPGAELAVGFAILTGTDCALNCWFVIPVSRGFIKAACLMRQK